MLKEWLHAFVWSYRHVSGKMKVPELSTICSLIAEDDVAIDIGAHAGSWSLPLARRLRAGKVLAVEALPYYASVLQKLFTLSGSANAHVINNAITAKRQQVQMVWKDSSGKRITGLTHIAGSGESTQGTVNVAGIPLDELSAGQTGRIRFVKCDVEGAEYNVFLGGLETLKKHRPFVFVELVQGHLARYGHSLDDVFRLFDSLNYSAWDLQDCAKPVIIDSVTSYRGHDVFFSPREFDLPWRSGG